MFYNQPLAHRFGTELTRDIQSGNWSDLDVAVAWVRRSGARHLDSSMRHFLARGGQARFTVGVDIENTSEEGLQSLLDWQGLGQVDTFVYHNEAQSVFHPKVFLLANATRARLTVGSNNLTAAGLFTNVEAGLQLDLSLRSQAIKEAKVALASWRDASSGFSKRLDAQLLQDLSAGGYVMSEAALLERRRKVAGQQAAKRRKGKRLFGSRFFRPPALPTLGGAIPTRSGSVLLLRARRASQTSRRTQIQIPITVVRTNFFSGQVAIESEHDGRQHPLVAASARGALNTIKVEIPEIDPFADPVLRIELRGRRLLYRAYDSRSTLGSPIRSALENGFQDRMNPTRATTGDRDHSTWWRFV